MLGCAGVFAEATAPTFRAPPGSEVEVTATAIVRRPAAVSLESVHLPFRVNAATVTLKLPRALAHGASFEDKESVRVPSLHGPTTPYWLETPPDAGLYHVSDPSLIGAPEGEPPLTVDFNFAIGGRTVDVQRAVAYKWTDPVMGERYRPFEITPAVSVRPEAGVLMFPGGATKAVTVRLTAGGTPAKGVLRAEAPAGWTVTPASIPFSLDGADAETRVAFQVRPPGAGAAAAVLRFVADADGKHLHRGVVRIEHPHIPIQTYLVDADVRLQPIELATGGVARIGYLPGPGDEVPASLRGVGYDVTVLPDEALAAGPAALSRFDAVVVGVRAFNTSEHLRSAHVALMAYVEAGGTLVVQYNTNNRLAALTAPLGPWPFDIGQKRVTDETAPVAFASPKHPALTSPNAIGDADFAGWVQERGLYFADKWDGRYEAPLSMHDPGEAPLAGSVLWTRYGKGTFVYTGLAFFRQLPAGVPGAYRLFANLLAAGRARGEYGR
jgi:hypothetical protein